MKFLSLDVYNLLWSFAPGGTASSFPEADLITSFAYNKDLFIHNIIGSGYINASLIGAYPYVACVAVNQNKPVIRIDRDSGVVTTLITLADASTSGLRVDIFGDVHYRQPIKVPAGMPVSVYIVRNGILDSSGQGIFHLLSEVTG